MEQLGTATISNGQVFLRGNAGVIRISAENGKCTIENSEWPSSVSQVIVILVFFFFFFLFFQVSLVDFFFSFLFLNHVNRFRIFKSFLAFSTSQSVLIYY